MNLTRCTRRTRPQILFLSSYLGRVHPWSLSSFNCVVHESLVCLYALVHHSRLKPRVNKAGGYEQVRPHVQEYYLNVQYPSCISIERRSLMTKHPMPPTPSATCTNRWYSHSHPAIPFPFQSSCLYQEPVRVSSSDVSHSVVLAEPIDVLALAETTDFPCIIYDRSMKYIQYARIYSAIKLDSYTSKETHHISTRPRFVRVQKFLAGYNPYSPSFAYLVSALLSFWTENAANF
jgi:hypothetical protein